MSMKNESLESIERSIKACKGYTIYSMMEALDMSYHIFTANYQDIQNKFKAIELPDFRLHIFQEENKTACTRYTFEIYRSFFNFEAAAVSLVDHSRYFINKYETHNKPFRTEYDQQTDKCFIQNPLIIFIQGLRNYVIHRSYPQIELTSSLTGIAKNQFLLNKEEISAWGGWSLKAKELLNSSENSIPLDKAITDYYIVIKNFYDWLFKRLKEIHNVDFQEVNSLVRERNELCGFQ